MLLLRVIDQEDVYRCESVRLLQEALQMNQTESNTAQQGEHHKAVCGEEKAYGCVLSVGKGKWQLYSEQWTCWD